MENLIERLRPELRELLDENQNVTKEFCIKFLELIPDEEKVMEENGIHFICDRIDYLSWGWALFGEWEEAEDEVRYLELFDLIEDYNL
jgi:hypothetical protein